MSSEEFVIIVGNVICVAVIVAFVISALWTFIGGKRK